MALGNFPQLPDGIGERVIELVGNFKSGKISYEDMRDNLILAGGRTRIDRSGISIWGDYGNVKFDRDEFSALTESLLTMVDVALLLDGKQMLIKCGDVIERLTFGFVGMIAKREEISSLTEEDETLPMIEFDPDKNGQYPETTGEKLGRTLLCVMDAFTTFADSKDEPGFKIHRMEELGGYLEGWKEFSMVLDTVVPLFELTVKKKIDKNGKAAINFAENFLNACGV